MTYKRKTIDYSQHQLAGHVPEQDGHFTVTFLPLIRGFTCHDVKKRPNLDKDQWVEVIHRNGERSRGPVETFAWGIHKCRPNERMDYILRKTIRVSRPVFEIIDLEITHYRTTPTPPERWVQGDPWPFEDEQVVA
jgi:hypothetical protein